MSAVAQDILRTYAGRRWPTLNHKGRMSRPGQSFRAGNEASESGQDQNHC